MGISGLLKVLKDIQVEGNISTFKRPDILESDSIIGNRL